MIRSDLIKSPGYAVPPIKLGQIANFNAPSLSRNPKIMFVFDALDLAERELKHLVDLNLLVRDGVGRSTVYRLA